MILNGPVRGTIRVNADNYPAYPGAWKRPAGNHEPAVTQDFGPSSVTDEPTRVWPGGEADIFGKPIPAGTYANFHEGIDISNAGCGYDVLAAATGKVTFSGRNSAGTEIIVIDHGQGFATRYAHLSQRFATVGSVITVGTVIGKTGNTGSLSTGCHLHFAVTKNGSPVDPWRRLAQNTSVDPDAPEDDMPAISTNLTGYTAKVGNLNGDANVRDGVTSGASVTRQITKGQTESWTIVGWVAGMNTAGSDQWLARVNGATWEYTHKINVMSVSAPPAPCSPADLDAAKALGYASAKAKASAAVAAI